MRKRKDGLKITSDIIKTLLIVILVIYCISLLIPILWMIYTSFKGNIEYLLDSFRLPKEWKFENYAKIWKLLNNLSVGSKTTYNVWQLIGTSFLWAGGNSLLSIALSTGCAYVLARYRFPGRKFIYMLGIFVMITPIVGNLPSAMYIRKALGVYDNLIAMILTNPCTAFSGLYFMLLYAGFKRMPWAYAESVFIDGGGHYRAFFAVMLPMMLPTCAAVFVLNFIGVWNDYMSFLIWLPNYANLAYGMYLFQSEASAYEASMPEILAGFVIVMIPTSLIYLAFQNLINSKFTVGGLKG